MTRPVMTRDFMNTDIEISDRFFVMVGTDAKGWIETRGPSVAVEYGAFTADGSFINWFRSRKAALSAIGC